MNQSPEERKCDCEEISCKEGCLSGHTHKTFWCEKCHPERHEGQVVEDAQERPWWRTKFEERFKDSFTYGAMTSWEDGLAIASFIDDILAESNRRIAERIKSLRKIKKGHHSWDCDYCGYNKEDEGCKC